MKQSTAILFALIPLLSCHLFQEPSPAGVFTKNIDIAVSPANDFFEYANGGWIRANPIPADRGSWGIGDMVNEENQNRLREINESVLRDPPVSNAVYQKIGLFWKAAMDTDKIERQGIRYLQPYLNKIDSIDDIAGFMDMVSVLYRIGVRPFFLLHVAPDEKSSNFNILKLNQGGLGMPDKDYYFNSDAFTVEARIAYAKYIVDVLKLLGQDATDATKGASGVYTFETRLAMYSRKPEDLRNPYKNYHKMHIRDLARLSKEISWRAFLASLGATNIDSVVVGQPEFFSSLGYSMENTSVIVFKNYLRFHLINHFAEQLPDEFGRARFAFAKLLSGARERKPRWKSVIAAEENAMGELLGEIYVQKYCDTKFRSRYEKMVDEIEEAFKERIRGVSWMSDSTREKAITKLEKIERKIGYPDQWKDFSGMEIGNDSYLQNMINAGKWWHNYNIGKLGRAVDKNEWNIYPQTYNACYNPLNNEIIFPAASFIIPGADDREPDDAVMYGYAGAGCIGHEITHGFDGQGRFYDGEGNLNSWWTNNDSAAFANREALIVQQFNDYEPVKGFHINGSATRNENIADLGGVEVAMAAFIKSEAYKENKAINGFTPMQRFFIGYALRRLHADRPDVLRNRLITDVCAPAKYRTIGPLSNITGFYKTYNVRPVDSMYRPDSLRARIW